MLLRSPTNLLWRNDGESRFIAVTPPALRTVVTAAAAAWGDYDHDRDLDLFVASATGPDRLLRNEGAAVFTDMTSGALAVETAGLATSWVDFDNDGNLDLHIVNLDGPDQLLDGDGFGAFVDVMESSGLRDGNHPGLAWGDSDADGDLDLYLLGRNGNCLLQNRLNSSHWLQVDLVGVSTNSLGIGARIRLQVNGVSQEREVSGKGGAPVTAAFGLGQATSVEFVQILWPRSPSSKLIDVGVDQRLRIEESDPVLSVAGPLLVSHGNRPNPFRPPTAISFDLRESASLQLTLYDVTGRVVRRLLDEQRRTGPHTVPWDGRDDTGRAMPTGVYFYQLLASDARATGKMLLTR